ncbi:MAG: hypothetical protein N4A40_01970 [Tissierellales bacterium]|jgi:hydroxymethylpyrimidine pyrophosphatase-like HAD family hydrolase|nr:hypothetical protein [Tissierellales bacterium]
MNIFASDLDQTLIYSKRWIENEKNVKCVEIYKDSPLSYMDLEAISNLKKILLRNKFVPITTRTIEQYNRIKLPVEVQTAVVANGGIIIENGEIDEVWSERIKSEISESLPLNLFMERLNELESVEGVLKIRQAENLFAYLVVEEELFDRKNIKYIMDKIDEMKWKCSDQGRKIYFLPKGLSKGAALRYLREKYNAIKVVSAGDSKLDESMDCVSEVFITPGHSKLENYEKTKAKGVVSAVEILKRTIEVFE